MASLKKSPMSKTHAGIGNGKQHLKSNAAAKSNAPAPGTLHPGQPKSLGGGGLKTGHTKTNN